jgi:cobalamin biosynthesis Mg chelatase CobN
MLRSGTYANSRENLRDPVSTSVARDEGEAAHTQDANQEGPPGCGSSGPAADAPASASSQPRLRCGGAARARAALVRGTQTRVSPSHGKGDRMTILWIIVVVVVVLALLGFLGFR